MATPDYRRGHLLYAAHKGYVRTLTIGVLGMFALLGFGARMSFPRPVGVIPLSSKDNAAGPEEVVQCLTAQISPSPSMKDLTVYAQKNESSTTKTKSGHAIVKLVTKHYNLYHPDGKLKLPSWKHVRGYFDKDQGPMELDKRLLKFLKVWNWDVSYGREGKCYYKSKKSERGVTDNLFNFMSSTGTGKIPSVKPRTQHYDHCKMYIMEDTAKSDYTSKDNSGASQKSVIFAVYGTLAPPQQPQRKAVQVDMYMPPTWYSIHQKFWKHLQARVEVTTDFACQTAPLSEFLSSLLSEVPKTRCSQMDICHLELNSLDSVMREPFVPKIA